MKKKHYTDYNKFAKRVGILNTEQLEALGWECDNDNRICFSQLDKLQKFVKKLNNKKGKKYHICTDYDACGAEESYCLEHGIDPEDQNRRVVATVMDNRIGFVNRMDYFLCDRDDDESISLGEIEEV